MPGKGGVLSQSSNSLGALSYIFNLYGTGTSAQCSALYSDVCVVPT